MRFLNGFKVPEWNVANPEQLVQEGWFNKVKFDVPEGFATLSLQEKVNVIPKSSGHALAEISTMMETSSYMPFKETADLVNTHIINEKSPLDRVDGGFLPQNEFLNPNQSEGQSFFVTHFNWVPEKNLWYASTSLNLTAFNAEFLGSPKMDQGNFAKAHVGLAVLHEVLGHYKLTSGIVNFWRQKNMSIENIMNKEIYKPKDNYQEHYAYAVEASAMSPILELGSEYSRTLTQEDITIGEKWKQYAKDPLSWRHPDWQKFINQLTGF